MILQKMLALYGKFVKVHKNSAKSMLSVYEYCSTTLGEQIDFHTISVSAKPMVTRSNAYELCLKAALSSLDPTLARAHQGSQASSAFELTSSGAGENPHIAQEVHERCPSRRAPRPRHYLSCSLAADLHPSVLRAARHGFLYVKASIAR
jgi:hypothetical protein